MVTSGIRIGTPALTSRGMGIDAMKLIAGLIDSVIKNIDDDSVIKKVNEKVIELCDGFPLYPEFND
jgi:glycine hydroxymethyltransferase